MKLLSKSKYVEGWQCLKRAYLSVNQPALATPPDEALRAAFAHGTRIGEFARKRWPGGELVDIHPFHHSTAVEVTRRLIEDVETQAIFEGGFTELGVRIRADVLVRTSDAGLWDLIEVKASISARAVYDVDIGIQAAVLQTAGIDLRAKMLLMVDPGYAPAGVALDPQRYFRLVDRTCEVDALQPSIHRDLTAMHEAVAAPTPPDITPSSHCFEPYECPFWSHCTGTRHKGVT